MTDWLDYEMRHLLLAGERAPMTIQGLLAPPMDAAGIQVTGGEEGRIARAIAEAELVAGMTARHAP